MAGFLSTKQILNSKPPRHDNARHNIAMKGQAMIWQEKLMKYAIFNYLFSPSTDGLVF
ncbi:MAG: hypothetical protein KJ666_08560 [Bacteroidetes bacterium]|nr:hypothetical protein [Bacteroidota bacterium]